MDLAKENMSWGTVQPPLSLCDYNELLEHMQDDGLKQKVEAILKTSMSNEDWDDMFANYVSHTGYAEVRNHIHMCYF